MQCSFEETAENRDGTFTHAMCINEACIDMPNDPCYGLCYTCAYRKLQAENEKLKEKIVNFAELGKKSAKLIITIVNLKSRIAELEKP